MPQFILLRDKARHWEKQVGEDFPFSLKKARPDQPVELAIEEIDIPPSEILGLAQEPSVLASARVMPTRMVFPEPMDDLRNEDAVPFWGGKAVGANGTSVSGRGVSVALLDTGIDANHVAFQGVEMTTRDFVGTGIADANGHGTHLAGTVFGRSVQGTQIGVADGIEEAIICKALTDKGEGTSAQFFRSLLWAYRQNADIIGYALTFDVNACANALYSYGSPQSLADAQAIEAERDNHAFLSALLHVMDAGRTGPLICAAVGNDSRRVIDRTYETGPVSTAVSRGVLAVGAVGEAGMAFVQADFSNYNADLVAPGTGVVSAHAGEGVRMLNGTSMAMAHAMGVAALWRESLGPMASTEMVLSRMATTARTIDVDQVGKAKMPMVQAPPF